jgi:hypothetical protein
MIQITHIRLATTAIPSPIVDISVAERLSNSPSPESLRRRRRRCLTQMFNPIATGIRVKEISKLYMGSSIGQPLNKVFLQKILTAA